MSIEDFSDYRRASEKEEAIRKAAEEEGKRLKKELTPSEYGSIVDEAWGNTNKDNGESKW